jgi:predicted dithiol-disulfide oxidoreductase (DUF899 family)
MITQPNESPEYRAAREALLREEVALRAKVEEVAAMRRALPKGGAVQQDYLFHDLDGAPVALAELFQDNCTTLLVYSFMFNPASDTACPACTSVMDGLNGQADQIGQRVSFAAVSSKDSAALAQLCADRGWDRLRMYSAAGTSYQKDYRGETSEGAQLPMLNVFERDGDTITHFWGSELFFAPANGHPRHVDQIWPLWNMLDYTREGRGDFFPDVGG